MKVKLKVLMATLLILISTIQTKDSFAVSATPSASCVSSSCTITFTYTGDYYSWTVPNGVSSIAIDAQGAQGGSTIGAGVGGSGGRVQSTLTVTSNSTLYIFVGGQGTSNGTGGYNGGGTASGITHGGSGGGASDLRTNISDLNSRLIVAGGGGGASAGSFPGVGGAGGGTTGGNGPTSGSYVGGKGGTQIAGGAGGSGYCSPAAGTFGIGGGTANMYHCPAGGGGWYGGGQGAVMGGGGGSSYANASFTSGTAHTQGFKTGNGQVIITYDLNPDTTPPSFTSSTSFSVAENIATTAAAATIKVSESATVTISSGADASLFNISNSDSVTALIKFKVSPNYEAPSDSGGNNVYDLVLTATDPSNNAGTQTITITVTDVLDTSSFNSFALAGGVSSATYRSAIQINVSVTVASKITFKAANVVIPGCKNVLAIGSGSTFTVSCSWKPSKRGGITLSATSTPTNVAISGANSVPIGVAVVNRSGPR